MKVRPPKEWQSLPQAQKDRIEAHAKQIAIETIHRDERIIIDLYIKMVCKTLHDVFGFGEKRLNLFLGNHKMLFREQIKKVRDNTQVDYLNECMARIFKKDGFPQGFFDKMLGEVEVTSND